VIVENLDENELKKLKRKTEKAKKVSNSQVKAKENRM